MSDLWGSGEKWIPWNAGPDRSSDPSTPFGIL